MLHYRFFDDTANTSATAVSTPAGASIGHSALDEDRDSLDKHFLESCDSAPDDSDRCMHRRRVGLAVAKNVGNAVTRNHVKRRFRQLASASEHVLPSVCDVVMRAKPHAAQQSYASLAEQVAELFSEVARQYDQQSARTVAQGGTA